MGESTSDQFASATLGLEAAVLQGRDVQRLLEALDVLGTRALRVPHESRLRLAFEAAMAVADEAQELAHLLAEVVDQFDELPSWERTVTDPELKSDERHVRKGSLEQELKDLKGLVEGDGEESP